MERLKEFHDAQDMHRVDAQRIHCSRLASSVPVLEHYIEGRASWFFDMYAPLKLNEVGKWVGGTPCIPMVPFPLLVFHVNFANRGIVNDWDEKPVLVSDVEFVHDANDGIPSIVRLYLTYEELGEVRSESVYLQVVKRRFKVIAGGMDWKLCSTPIPRGNQATHCLKPCMIEGALKIMNGIPDYCGEGFETLPILRICKIALDEFVSSIRIYMTQTDQSFFQAVDAKFNIRDVLVGPFDLKTCTFKKCAHAERV